jgi:hypothetical protein
MYFVGETSGMLQSPAYVADAEECCGRKHMVFNAMIFWLTIVHGKYKAEAYDGLDVAELAFTSLT